jgi:hypothetical protein
VNLSISESGSVEEREVRGKAQDHLTCIGKGGLCGFHADSTDPVMSAGDELSLRWVRRNVEYCRCEEIKESVETKLSSRSVEMVLEEVGECGSRRLSPG